MTSSNKILSARILGLIILAAFVGGVAGAIVAMCISFPSWQTPQSTSDHLEVIGSMFGAEWPRVEYAKGWYTDLYNAQDPLEYEWWSLATSVRIDGIDFVRDEVMDWRERYADWVEEAGQAFGDLSSTDPHYRSVETVHFRGVRILEHVDAILEQ